MNSNKKILKVHRIKSHSDEKEINKYFNLLDKNVPSTVLNISPWSLFPYKPHVKFKIGYSNSRLWIKAEVSEKYIRAKYVDYNDPVYLDSCFEFFISFDQGKSYYNFEFNCIGTTHLAFGKTRMDREISNLEIIKLIETKSTLGNLKFSEKSGNFIWDLYISIPLKAFFKHKIDDLKGEIFQGNFYKCGDELTVPHYLCWNEIKTTAPDFHRPEHFGELVFV